MPLGSFLRTDGQTNAARSGNTYVPYNAVLFYYGKREDFKNTPSGTLNYDHYREYSDIYYPVSDFYDANNNLTTLKSNPLISCVSLDSDWQSNTGVCRAATTNLPNTGATLFNTYSHSPSTLVRTTIYNSTGALPGETQSSVTYREQFGENIHDHSVVKIADNLRSIAYGEKDYLGNFQGINAVAVNPIIRDPLMTTTVTTYNDTKLYYFPKNVIVFANNLSKTYYTRDDSKHVYSANGKILPLIATNNNQGILNIANTLTFSMLSNTVLAHNHDTFPAVNKKKSTKTNQKGYLLIEAGIHNHVVNYTANVALRSKILKAWITKDDQTPISNGVIIAYSIGPSTLYPGIYSNSTALPAYWHFCNGNNGTPDLRGYFIYANFDTSNTYHDVVYNSSNTMVLTSINMEANGNHSHLNPVIGFDTGVGTNLDIGSHTYEDELDHTHTVSTSSEFKLSPSDTSNVININVTTSNTYTYVPPRVDLAFIMYNENIP